MRGNRFLGSGACASSSGVGAVAGGAAAGVSAIPAVSGESVAAVARPPNGTARRSAIRGDSRMSLAV